MIIAIEGEHLKEIKASIVRKWDVSLCPYFSQRHEYAITFSNNAATEMRSRILQWLKALSLGRLLRCLYFSQSA